MKKIIVPAILILSFFACKSKMTKRTIEFVFTSTMDYCGGAPPPDELIADLKAPKPFTGTVYIHQKSDRTDDGYPLVFKDGKASLAGFVKGDYHIFQFKKINLNIEKQEQVADSPHNNIDCLKSRSLRPLGKITLMKNTKLITSQIHIICDPCMEPRP